ncbi:hypothetical protein [Ekhidna sp.]
MTISETHQKINALKSLTPGAFIFVLDTTDRSFVYKSMISPDCEQRVVSLDREYGIDTLTKSSSYYSHDDNQSVVKFKRLSENVFIGVCTPISNFAKDVIAKVEEFLKK